MPSAKRYCLFEGKNVRKIVDSRAHSIAYYEPVQGSNTGTTLIRSQVLDFTMPYIRCEDANESRFTNRKIPNPGSKGLHPMSPSDTGISYKGTTMSITGKSPAGESYAFQREFHKRTWSNVIRGTVAGLIPAQWRQRLRLRRRLEVAKDYAFDGVDWLFRRKRELIPPRHLNFVGHGNFEATGDEFLRYFIEFGNLKPEHHVLEIGCGVGRMARPLTKYLTNGDYQGIDIVPKAIRWCQNNITARYPNFHFYLADIHNLAYNPHGRLQSIEYKFPFAEGTFDFAFLSSVFSHMLTADMKHYLAQTAACLRINGKCLITFFLLNDESRRLIRESLSALTFQFARAGCNVSDDLVPEYAVAYAENDIRALFQEAGLEINAIHYGAWSGRSNFVSYQDMVIATKVR